MKRDPVVLGKNCVLSGDDVGITRPNANVLVVGTTGCGKSTSVVLPTLARSKYSNPIVSFAKENDARKMACFLEHKGYTVRTLNLVTPEESTFSFDPLLSVESETDIDTLSAAIVYASLKRTTDDYWEAKAISLLGCLIRTVLMSAKPGTRPGMSDLFSLFYKVLPVERAGRTTAESDNVFNALSVLCPDCTAVRDYRSWASLPYKTASCVRDTLDAALKNVFTESVRNIMQSKPQIDAHRFSCRKEAIIIVTSAIDTSQQVYVNLFFRDLNRQLLKLAARRPNGELPREIRFIYDDMACSCRIDGLEHDLSLYRSAGMSSIMLLQSESQLESNYSSAGAAIIRQNCAVYAYFPGGFDDRSCEIVAKRMNLPYEDVLYAPLGNVFVMQSGCKPVSIPRYDTLHSNEYRSYVRITSDKRKCQLEAEPLTPSDEGPCAESEESCR